ncbi:hypothetical protein COOONC_23016 [Cooperia oncophora]
MVFLTAALLVGCILNLFNYRCHVVTPNHYFFKIGDNVLCIVLSFYFIRMSGHLSQKTKRMQRRFLIYLCIQVAIPALTMLVPVLMLVYVFGASTDGGLGNVALAVIGSHGCVSSLSVVMCNEPYRNYATEPFKKRKFL